MIDIHQFRVLVVRPTLVRMQSFHQAMRTPAVENLLVGTAVQESHLTYLAQKGGGPALGVMQIEPVTHDDAWESFIHYRPELGRLIRSMTANGMPSADQLVTNLAYSVAMARLVYWRAKEPMPIDPDDIDALAAYWKKHYNTIGGAGSVEEFVHNYDAYMKGGA